MKIYLIGMPLSGKSTVGKKLSKYLKFKFIDLDEFIESNYAISINELLINNQEDKFRFLEEKALKECLNEVDVVISTGGGIIKKQTNYYLMDGPIIFLDVPVNILEKREKNDYVRPLLKHSTLKHLYQERLNDYYSFADIIVKAEKSDKALKEIIKALEEEGFI